MELTFQDGLTHFLPEFFPDPWRFDPTRYMPPRQEQWQGHGLFAPYTLGSHTCLGAGAAELQLLVTAGAVLHAAHLELEPLNYEIVTKYLPIPGPDPKFKVRVGAHRPV